MAYRLREVLENLGFIARHRARPEDFTRKRKLGFREVFVLILQKSCLSLQAVVNKLTIDKVISDTVSSSAYIQAREKLRHTAFQELIEHSLDVFHEEASLKLFKGYRLIGIDATSITLPESPELAECFGQLEVSSPHPEKRYYTRVLLQACYDLLNNICLRSALYSANSYEATIAEDLVSKEFFDNKSILVCDRGYASYKTLSFFQANNQNYIVRIPQSHFKITHEMFLPSGSLDKTVTIYRTKGNEGDLEEITVRFVRVILKTGEIEVLATNIFEGLSPSDLKELYGLRWGVETFFFVLKERLNLEKFTGKSVESVLQDIWGTVLLSNLETIFTYNINQSLARHKSLKGHKKSLKKVNRTVSFSAMKHKAFDLLFGGNPIEDVCRELQSLFLTNLIPIRPNREVPHKTPSNQQRITHHIYRKKFVF